MKAIIRNRFGSPDVLRYDATDVPIIGPGELLVRVRAAGVNRGDALELRGWPYVARLLGQGMRRPKHAILGTDLAGTVVATGPGVEHFDVDDEIVGWGTGAFAEYTVVPASKATRRPDALDAIGAAALPTAGVTAWQAIADAGRVDAGHRVLVIGAAGGVGTYVTQLANDAGAIVTAVVGTAHLEVARSLGAAGIIDHRRSDVTELHRHFDVIVDLVGVHRLSDLRRMLTARGTLVVVGGQHPQSITGMRRFAGAAVRSLITRRRLTPLFATQDTAALERLMALVASGRVRPVIGRTYDLSETAAALHQIETGHTTGKLVVTA